MLPMSARDGNYICQVFGWAGAESVDVMLKIVSLIHVLRCSGTASATPVIERSSKSSFCHTGQWIERLSFECINGLREL